MTRLRIVLSELPENVIQEVVAYTWNQYLADIGGATSLILGSRLQWHFGNFEFFLEHGTIQTILKVQSRRSENVQSRR